MWEKVMNSLEIQSICTLKGNPTSPVTDAEPLRLVFWNAWRAWLLEIRCCSAPRPLINLGTMLSQAGSDYPVCPGGVCRVFDWVQGVILIGWRCPPLFWTGEVYWSAILHKSRRGCESPGCPHAVFCGFEWAICSDLFEFSLWFPPWLSVGEVSAYVVLIRLQWTYD